MAVCFIFGSKVLGKTIFMGKTQQLNLDDKIVNQETYSDRIIAKTSKRKIAMNRKPQSWSTSLLEFPQNLSLTSAAICEASTSTVKRPQTKRLVLWSDRRKVSPLPANKTTVFRKRKVQRNLTGFIIIWLCPNDATTDVKKFIDTYVLNQNFEFSVLNNKIILFNNLKRCFQYVSNTFTEKIFFIISGPLSKAIVSLLYEHHKIHFIYIECKHKIEHERWLKITAEKVRGIFYDKNCLIDKLKEDLATMLSGQTMLPSISVLSLSDKEKSIRDMDTETANFLWFQLLLEILLRFPSRTMAKKEMINESKLQYYDNESELKKIDEFEKNYSSSNAISWYTRDCFIYRLLNRAFRLQDIDLIFKFRFIIIDIYKELNKLHQKFVPTAADKTLVVYRGQGMFTDEFNSLRKNIGGYVSINSFFSTSKSSEVALIFTGYGAGRPLIESVLFEIEIDTNSTTKPFANIKNESYLKTEDEILLSMGSIFRIETVEPITDDIWLVKLVLEREDRHLSELMTYFMDDIGEKPSLLTFALYLYRMGDYSRTEKYLRIVLRNYYLNPIGKAITLNLFGGLYDEKGDYDKALFLYKKALNIQLKHRVLWKDPQCLAMTYNNIAKTYDSNGQYNLALVYYRKSLILDHFSLEENSNALLTTSVNIASVHLQQGKIGKALKSSTKSLALLCRCMPRGHPDIAVTYNNIGQICFKAGNYTQASLNYQKALDVQEKFLIPTHSSLAVTYSNIGELNSELSYYDTALKYYKKAADIQHNALPLNHPDSAVIFDNIGCVYSKTGDFDTALEYFQKALSIELISLRHDHPALGTTYNNIGNTYYHKKLLVLASQNFRKAIKIHSASSRRNDPSLTAVYNNMGLVYYERKQYTQALKYHKKSLAIKLSHLSAHHPELGSSYNNIGLIYHRKGNYTMALKNYQKCIEIRLQTLPESHPDISTTYQNIGMVYCDKNDYEHGLIYLNKALDIQLACNQPNLATTYLNLAQVYMQQNNRDLAKTYYEKYLEFQTKVAETK